MHASALRQLSHHGVVSSELSAFISVLQPWIFNPTPSVNLPITFLVCLPSSIYLPNAAQAVQVAAPSARKSLPMGNDSSRARPVASQEGVVPWTPSFRLVLIGAERTGALCAVLRGLPVWQEGRVCASLVEEALQKLREAQQARRRWQEGNALAAHFLCLLRALLVARTALRCWNDCVDTAQVHPSSFEELQYTQRLCTPSLPHHAFPAPPTLLLCLLQARVSSCTALWMESCALTVFHTPLAWISGSSSSALT